MRDFNDYQQLQTIYDSARSLLLRVIDRQSGQTLILKIARDSGNADLQPGKLLQQEFQRLQSIDHPYIINARELVSTPYGTGYSMEDIGGLSLADCLQQQSLSLDKALPLALQLSEALQAVHQAGYSHRDLNPANIVWNREHAALRLIDFGLAGRNMEQPEELTLAGSLQGTLPYLAPEQSGRVGRPVDYRSDFYSLGATLYQLFCGQPPFAGNDYAELVHAHIARTPKPAWQCNPAVPRALSVVLDKLLAKSPDDRYQSAEGLRADLQHCLQLCQAGSDDPNFIPGGRDHAARLMLPQRLYGRDAELALLQQAITAAAAGQRQCLRVSGEPGSGKSFLVNAARQRLAQQQGWFAQGKFDIPQVRRPYAAIRQLCRQLVLQALTDEPQKLESLRQQLQIQLANHTAELLQQLPELLPLLGSSSAAAANPSGESTPRIASAFQTLVQQLQQYRQPLLLFIDDLQWADHASLSLLEALQADPDCAHLCLVVSCRSDELVAGSKAEAFWQQLAAKNDDANHITLSPLSHDTIGHWLADALQRPLAEVAGLTLIVQRKTGGNPFFIRQFIGLATEHDVFRYQQGWQWDDAALQALTATDNVIDLTIAHLQTLPVDTCSLLGCAACMGNQCELSLLARANLHDETSLLPLLQPALDAGAIVLHGGVLHFAHDRINEALQTLYADMQRQIWHARLGQLLAESCIDDPQKLIEAANQLNLGGNKLPDAWRAQLPSINRQAAAAARAENDFDLATDFYAQAASLMPAETWEQNHAAMLALHIDWAEAAFLAGHYHSAQNLFATLHSHASELDDRVRIATSEILFYEKTNLFQKAIELANQLLHELGIYFPAVDEIDGPRSLAQLQRLQVNLQRIGMQNLATLPPARDSRISTAADLLMSVAVPYWNCYPHAFPFVLMEAACLSLEHGMLPSTANALSFTAAALCAGFQQYELGYQLGQAALALPDAANSYHQCQRLFLFHNMVRVYRDPPLAGMAELLDACQRGIDTGNRQWAAYCINHYCLRGLLAGLPLPQVQQAQQQLTPAMQRLQQEDAYGLFDSVRQAVIQLQQPEFDPHLLRGDFFDETEALPRYQHVSHFAAIALAVTCKLLLLLVRDEWAAAAALADQHEALLNAPTGQLQTEFGLAFAALAWLQRGNADTSDSTRADAIIQRLQQLEQHNPSGIAPLRLLLTARQQQQQGRLQSAAQSYDQAIDAAAAINMLHWLALSQRLAANYWQKHGHPRAASSYLLEAQHAWQQWGMPAGVKTLQQALPAGLQAATRGIGSCSANSQPGSSASRIDQLDFAAVVKMNQAIAAELVLDKLLGSLLRLAMENAGAEAGSLLLPVDGQLMLAARCDAATAQPQTFTPFEQPSALPQAAMRYSSDTQMPLLIDDLQQDPAFGGAGLHGALLVIPLLLQQKLQGLICLTHRHLPGAFRPEHLTLLQLLSSQMAIALDNALLYQHLANSNQVLQQNYQALQQANAARDRAEAKMAKLANAVEQTADAVMITNRDGIIEYVNQAFERITGFSSAEALGQTPRLLKSGQHPHNFYQRLWHTLLSGKSFSDMLVNRRKDGSLYYEERTITPLSLDGTAISHFVATGKDITERLQTEQRLHHLATHDALTGLPNRNLFVEQLKLALAATQWHQRCVAVMVIDLDRFKLINDTLGHEGGDKLLTTLAQRISQQLGQSDTVARFGGAEFAVMLNGVASTDEVPKYAERILAALAQPVLLAEREVVVTASIGISLSPHDSSAAQDLLRNAHAAMHRAKADRRNSWQFFTADLNTLNFERLELETLLRHALEQNRFHLVFQPQVLLTDRCQIGMEALLRWQHPSGKTVSPAQFIPLLEETGLIVPVGAWVIRESCRRAVQWQKQGHRAVRMSVNIAAQQLQNGQLPALIAACLAETGLDPQWLELELTESTLIGQADSIRRQLTELRDMGVRLAIDDFGTGYSSLSYLRHFPISTLKIDQSFVRGLPEVREDVALVRSIVALANGLALEVIAEGIETEQQAAFFAEFPGMIAQGYLFSRPQPFEQLLDAASQA